MGRAKGQREGKENKRGQCTAHTHVDTPHAPTHTSLPGLKNTARLFRVLITLDTLVVDNEDLGQAWLAYKKMMQYVRKDPAAYGMGGGPGDGDEDASAYSSALQRFDSMLLALDESVMAGAMFRSCIECDFDTVSSVAGGGEFSSGGGVGWGVGRERERE